METYYIRRGETRAFRFPLLEGFGIETGVRKDIRKKLKKGVEDADKHIDSDLIG